MANAREADISLFIETMTPDELATARTLIQQKAKAQLVADEARRALLKEAAGEADAKPAKRTRGPNKARVSRRGAQVSAETWDPPAAVAESAATEGTAE